MRDPICRKVPGHLKIMHDRFGRQTQKSGNAEREAYEQEFQTAVAHNKALRPLLSKVCRYVAQTHCALLLPVMQTHRAMFFAVTQARRGLLLSLSRKFTSCATTRCQFVRPGFKRMACHSPCILERLAPCGVAGLDLSSVRVPDCVMFVTQGPIYGCWAINGTILSCLHVLAIISDTYIRLFACVSLVTAKTWMCAAKHSPASELSELLSAISD